MVTSENLNPPRGRGDTERLDPMPFTNGKAAYIRARWIEGEALRQLRFGLVPVRPVESRAALS